MADIIEHIWQARHNEECARFILNEGPKFRDWAITAAFYAVVHWAEACFTTLPKQTIQEKQADSNEENAHKVRAAKIQRAVSTLTFTKYRKLQNACWNVRYLGQGPWQKQYNFDTAQEFVNMVPDIRDELLKAFRVRLP